MIPRARHRLPLVARLRRRRFVRGLTLLEIMVSVGILALIGTLIYGAFDGMSRARKGLDSKNQQYHQGRRALARMSREIQSAFISLHRSVSESQRTTMTVFMGKDQRPADRLDFTSFSHRRIKRDAHESDQNELSYFASRDPSSSRKLDLVRREDTTIDLDPERGGVVQVMAENIERFDLTFLDPLTGEWVESWDSTQPSGQLERLPLQVKIELVLKANDDESDGLKLSTKVPVAMQYPLLFAKP
jgi:general secretion pathway protein J